MGAWGIGHFDNDDAGDWVWELEDAQSLGPVEEAIAAAEAATDYLEAPDATIALAAAEVIAAALGKPADDLPESAAAVVAVLPHAPSPDLVARARAVVERVGADSELRELWEETDDFAAWQSKVADLLQRLQ